MDAGVGMDFLRSLGEFATAIPYGLGFGLGLLGIRVLAMVLAQWNVKEDRIDKGNAKLIEQQQSQIKGLLEWKERVEKALEECQERHAASEQEVARLSGLLQGYGDARQLAQINAAADRAAARRKERDQ